MSALWIGIIIGFVMGLTGSGGALISIPLFILNFEMTLKEATSFSLVAVALSAFFNLLTQWEEVDLKLALWIIPFSIISSFLFIPVKVLLSEWIIFILLFVVSLFGLISVWWPNKNKNDSRIRKENIPILGSMLGVALGILTTLTGLGGGVLMMPALISFFQFPHEKAVATSLLPIFVTSVAAFLFQWKDGLQLPEPKLFFYLFMGILLVAILFPILTRNIPKTFTLLLRKISFSLIAIFSLSSILEALP
ncbi:sulfite exporter TauE/SafE family protein [Leptospira ognonensis]|uniref:Probable membrane transporter protein n=1 Tax=Leptospira ognonensis TaxID=2484945 RepID=A0A4V3JQV7_9LEPT|nr:sulfite exporter TauE/SafE family protein [Leptospira ognonensis]TGL57076.1 sulfite exporter TauE/SafE family protein [Leptospira ognonensis]